MEIEEITGACRFGIELDKKEIDALYRAMRHFSQWSGAETAVTKVIENMMEQIDDIR